MKRVSLQTLHLNSVINSWKATRLGDLQGGSIHTAWEPTFWQPNWVALLCLMTNLRCTTTFYIDILTLHKNWRMIKFLTCSDSISYKYLLIRPTILRLLFRKQKLRLLWSKSLLCESILPGIQLVLETSNMLIRAVSTEQVSFARKLELFCSTFVGSRI